ncbi:O-antigen ligase family protein [Litoribacillus peritrichatus]|uniref:O-antigen ligase-related domain-containing protein n=1 Tax=Litoribacillus peritrichatus TaxID=718191 RepID=A0ABP7M3J7_9GAMM
MKVRVPATQREWMSLLMIIAIFVVDAVFRVRSYDDKSLDTQVVLKLLVYCWIFMLGGLLQRETGVTFRYLHNKAVLLLIVGFTLSSFWAPNMAYALVASFSLLSYFLFITSYASLNGTDELLTCMAKALFIFICVSFLFYFFIPEVGKISYWEFDVYVEGGRMSGIAGSANNLGRIACLGVILSVYFMVKGKTGRLYKWLLILSLAALVLSLNRSSFLMAIIGSWIVTFSWRYRQIYALVLLIGVICIIGSMFFLEDLLLILSRSGNLDEILTFTGRTYIWSVVTDLLLEKPLIGYGYGSSMFVLPVYEYAIGFTASHAHNMILQVLLYLGVVGGLIMMSSFILFFVGQKNITKIQMALIVYVLYNGLLESGAFNGLVNITTVALFVAFNAVEREKVS